MPSGSYIRGRAARALVAVACASAPGVATAQDRAAAVLPAPVETAPEDTALARGGESVTVAGRALVASGVLHDRSLSIALDRGATAVWVFSRSGADVHLRAGDSVEATGVLHRYRGTTEVVASRVRRVDVPTRPPTPPPVMQASTSQVV